MVFLKILLSLFCVVLIPIYWYQYGPTNFLWFSDIGLFLTVFALWLNSPLLISMVCVGILPIELAWNVDFIVQLLTGFSILGIAGYMFDNSLPFYLRALSLFHLVTPIIWIYYINLWGYDKRAFWYWTYLFWTIIVVTYLVSDPAANINWVFSPQIHHWNGLSKTNWILFLMIFFPVAIFLPTHYLLTNLFKIAYKKTA